MKIWSPWMYWIFTPQKFTILIPFWRNSTIFTPRRLYLISGTAHGLLNGVPYCSWCIAYAYTKLIYFVGYWLLANPLRNWFLALYIFYFLWSSLLFFFQFFDSIVLGGRSQLYYYIITSLCFPFFCCVSIGLRTFLRNQNSVLSAGLT